MTAADEAMGYTPTTVDAVALLAQQAVELQEVDTNKTFAVVLTEDQHLQVVAPRGERILDNRPIRKRGDVELHDAKSVADWVNLHKIEGTTLYADIVRQRLVAVVNGDTDVDAGWGDHRATMKLEPTPAWVHWTKQDGNMQPQVAFAEHVERGLREIHKPTGAFMLEIAQTFHATSKVNFIEGTRLDSGQTQLVYEETITAKAGQKGTTSIPPQMELALQPFEGSRIYAVPARIRYRIHEGRLTIGYLLDQPDEILREAFRDIVKAIEEGTGLTALNGLAPHPTPVVP